MTHCRDTRRPPAAARSSRWGSSVKGWAAGSEPPLGAAACAGLRCRHYCCLGKTGGKKHIWKTRINRKQIARCTRIRVVCKIIGTVWKIRCHYFEQSQNDELAMFVCWKESDDLNFGCKMTKYRFFPINRRFVWSKQIVASEGRTAVAWIPFLLLLSSAAVWLSVLITLLPPSWHAG